MALVSRAPEFRPNYQLLTGLELLERGDLAAGLERLDRALALKPGDAEAQNAAAYTLALQGVELDRAEALSLQSLEQMPNEANFLDTLGWIYCRQGRSEEGRATLLAAAEASTVPIPEVAEHLDGCSDAAIR